MLDGLFFDLDIKLSGLGFGWVKSLAAGTGQVKIDAGIAGYAPILLRATVLNTVKGFTEHRIVRFFTVKQKVNGFPDAFIINLAVQILVNHFGPLFSGNI